MQDPRRTLSRSTGKRLKDQIDSMIAQKGINPWCGICRAASALWVYEDRATVYRTIEAATPAIERLQLAQLETAALIGELFGPKGNN